MSEDKAAEVPIDQDPSYLALLAAADKIDSNAAALQRVNKSLSTQIIIGAMQGAAAVVRTEAYDRLCALANEAMAGG